jgi:hypothetical protein
MRAALPEKATADLSSELIYSQQRLAAASSYSVRGLFQSPRRPISTFPQQPSVLRLSPREPSEDSDGLARARGNSLPAALRFTFDTFEVVVVVSRVRDAGLFAFVARPRGVERFEMTIDGRLLPQPRPQPRTQPRPQLPKLPLPSAPLPS